MHDITVLYIWMHPIPDSFNRVMYQRPLFIAQKYAMIFLAMGEKYIPEEIAKKCTVIRSPFGRIKMLGPLFYAIWVILFFIKYLPKRDSTIVYTFHDLSIAFGTISKVLGYIWVTDIWDDPALPLHISSTTRRARALAWVRVLMAKLFIRHADMIIASIRPELLNRYHVDQTRVCAIPNGVDIQRTRSIAESIENVYHDAGKYMRIIYVGPIIRERAIDVLIRAAATAATKGHHIHLILVGPIDEVTYVNSLIDEFIHIPTFKSDVIGQVEHKHVLQLIASADVAVNLTRPIPNYLYAYPIKVFEYMALGKAIITSKSYTMNQIFRHMENGILVDIDMDEIAYVIAWLAQNPDKRAMLGKQAYRTVIRYDWAEIHNHLSKCLDRVFSG